MNALIPICDDVLYVELSSVSLIRCAYCTVISAFVLPLDMELRPMATASTTRLIGCKKC
jgi:hypothetical protein